MLLFLKAFMIGIGKIIPGVSGAMLAINFGIYERLLDAVTNFFYDWKENLKFLFVFGSGILLAIILCSNIILYLLNSYMFMTMLFFIGLIIGGTYNFSKSIKFNYKNSLLVIFIIILLLILGINNFNNNYILKNNFWDSIIFFVGGIIEMFASIVPGISGTSLLMLMGIYDNILEIIANIFDYRYVIMHLNIYISYGLGMITSFMVNAYLINYFIKKYRELSNLIILGLSIASIIILLVMTFKNNYTSMEFVLGILLLIGGIYFNKIIDK